MNEDLTIKSPQIDDSASRVSMKPITTTSDDDIEDVDFNFDGYQVVRGEFFSHIYEPSITFNGNKVYVNTTCIKKIPNHDYVQILVNPDEKKLAVRPCLEDERDSFRWCSASKKRTPKQITCRVFFAKVVTLMSWNPAYRYKLLGKLIRSNNELLFVFDLRNPEIYQRTVKEDGKIQTSRTPIFQESWKNQFGLSYEEHRKSLQVGIFEGYAVFGLQKEQTKRNEQESEESVNEQLTSTKNKTIASGRPEEEQNSNPQSNLTYAW